MDISEEVIIKMKIEAAADSEGCSEVCRDFDFMYTPYDLDKLFVRYIRADISNPENPVQYYRWICFDRQGVRLECDPVFQSVADENEYKGSMIHFHFLKYLS